METITSTKNPRVLRWRSLSERKGRRAEGCFLAEGRKMVSEALASGFPVEAVLLDESRLDTLTPPEGVPCFCLAEHVFAAVCDTKTPQGIAAVVRMAPRPPAGTRLLALDDVQDPGNVGTILRTADAAGIDGVLLSAGCADVFSPKVLRATMGSIFRVGLRVTDDLPGALRELREAGFTVLSSQLDGEPFYRRGPVGERFCLIVGNEGNGISEACKREATMRVRLPMRGGAESLNAAVAAGIMMYGLTREAADDD